MLTLRLSTQHPKRALPSPQAPPSPGHWRTPRRVLGMALETWPRSQGKEGKGQGVWCRGGTMPVPVSREP